MTQQAWQREWRFTPHDTWFFRESRPFDAIGGIMLSSNFPPPARTMAGAVRTAIGDAAGVDWSKYQEGEAYRELRSQMGDAQSMGCLQLGGPYLLLRGERLYPAPSLLLRAAQEGVFLRLQPAPKPVECDLGLVCLPQLPENSAGAKNFDGWLTLQGMKRFLQGHAPSNDQAVQSTDLFRREGRLGLAVNADRHTAEAGALYQTSHVRVLEGQGLAVAVTVTGIEEKWQKATGVVRLGGEGRMAGLTLDSKSEAVASAVISEKRLLLCLATDADFDGQWIFPGFASEEVHGQKVWRGQLAGVAIRVLCAATGKLRREGGWDMARRAPRAARALVPAGSCYFCEVEDEVAAATLHGQRFGLDTELGRGEVIVGTW